MNERAFYRVLREWQARPFDWHRANCCQFAAEVARCWGVEHAIPEFETVEEAAAWLRAQGARSLYEYLRRLFGNPVPPLQARRGFIAYRKGVGLEGSAIGTIDRKALFVSDRGLIQVPLGQIAGAFNPGRFRG